MHISHWYSCSYGTRYTSLVCSRETKKNQQHHDGSYGRTTIPAQQLVLTAVRGRRTLTRRTNERP